VANAGRLREGGAGAVAEKVEGGGVPREEGVGAVAKKVEGWRSPREEGAGTVAKKVEVGEALARKAPAPSRRRWKVGEAPGNAFATRAIPRVRGIKWSWAISSTRLTSPSSAAGLAGTPRRSAVRSLASRPSWSMP